MRQREHQSGFGTTVILLAVLVVAVLALTGVVIYQRHKTNDAKDRAAANQTQTTTTQPKNTTTTQPATTTTQYLTIKEWGIRSPYSGSLTLQYAPNGPNNMAVSSAQLAAGGPAVCSAAGNSDAGNIARYLPSDSNLGPQIPANETAQQYIQQNPTVPHATVGSYIYIYWGYVVNGVYTGPCNDKAAALQTTKDFSDLVTKLQAAQ